MWSKELCIRYCDICKDFRFEIPAIHSSKTPQLPFCDIVLWYHKKNQATDRFFSLQVTQGYPKAIYVEVITKRFGSGAVRFLRRLLAAGD